MAHFAEVSQGSVIRVVVVRDADAPTEEAGAAFCRSLFGGTWVQTSYNGNIRKRFAGIGFAYDAVLNAFVSPKPHPSWNLNTTTAQWEAPSAAPTTPGLWEWDETVSAYIDATGVVDNVTFTLRFTGTEQQRIAASNDPMVRGAMARLKATSRVRPKHPDTVQLLGLLSAKGMLDAPSRKDEILNPTA